MENRFDVLAKSLAESVSRREALSRLGGGVAGLLLAAIGLDRAWGVPGTGKGIDCGNVCNAAFNPTAKATRAKNQQCKQTCLACQAAAGTTCGIAANGTMSCCSGATPTCCGGVCTTLGTDAGNCGNCGTVCPSPANAVGYCQGGDCGYSCAAGFGACDSDNTNGCETPLNTTTNCGICGSACTTAPDNAVPICNNGTCGFACNSGFNNIQDANACVACIPAGSPVSACIQGLCCGGGIDCNPNNRRCL